MGFWRFLGPRMARYQFRVAAGDFAAIEPFVSCRRPRGSMYPYGIYLGLERVFYTVALGPRYILHGRMDP